MIGSVPDAGVRRTELIRLLTDYRATEADELEYRVRMLDLAAAASDPFDRYHYSPGHFTSSGFVVHPGGSSVLLIHHAKLDRWLQPGGHIELGDGSLIEAARREIEEETGVTGLVPVTEGLVDIDIHEFPATADQPFHHHFDLRFGFVAPSDRLGTSDEVLDVRWVAASALHELSNDRSVVRPVGKLIARDNLTG